MTVAEAAAQGDVEQLRVLLDAGGDPNAPETEEHWPPLHEAAYHDHVEAARLLLDAGADMYLQNKGGETPLCMAIQQGSMGVFRLLVERGCQFDSEREKADWLLTQSAGHGHLELVRWLLDQGVDVNITNDSGCTALTYAAKGSHREVVEELIRAGADVNHRDNDTETVLMWAADHAGNAAVLRILLQAGADVNARNDSEGTALSWTVWSKEQGDAEMAATLLEAGADANSSRTLILAAYYGFTDVVRLLLKYGADFRVTDSEGKTPLDLAKNRGHREVALLLRQAEVDRQLQETGKTTPPPRYPMGTHVRTLNGTPYEGWIALAEWHHKHDKYGYFIEVEATTQLRKTLSKRYWEEDLQPIKDEPIPV